MIEKITDHNLERYDSRLKEWCDRKFFEKGNYGKYETTEEAGAVAFYPAPNTPLEGKVKFSFKETMPANGDKGPDNPSTITGISSIYFCRTGKNIIDISKVDSLSSNGITVTPLNDGSIVLNGTLNSSTNSYLQLSNDFYPHINSKITMSALNVSGTCVGSSAIQVVGYTATGGQDYILWQYTDRNIVPATIKSNYCHRIRLYISHGSTFENYKFYPMVELGDTPSNEFELGTFDSFSSSLGNTYYGGEIDLATGVMTVTWVCLDLDNIKDKFSYTYNVSDGVRNNRRYAVKLDGSVSGLPAIILGAPVGSCSCTHFLRKDFDVPSSDKSFGVFEQQLNNRWFMFYDDSLTITDDSKTNAENLQAFQNWLATQKANGTPVEYVYMLNTPFTVQLTPQQILSLSQIDKYTPRLNTVYTDTDSIQISYLKSPIRDEYEKTQAILSLGGNS